MGREEVAARGGRSVARSRTTACEALERPDVPLGLGETVTAALRLPAAVFSILGLEDLGKCLQIGLEGVVGILLGHDGPSWGVLVLLGAIERRGTGVRSRNGKQHG